MVLGVAIAIAIAIGMVLLVLLVLVLVALLVLVVLVVLLVLVAMKSVVTGAWTAARWGAFATRRQLWRRSRRRRRQRKLQAVTLPMTLRVISLQMARPRAAARWSFG